MSALAWPQGQLEVVWWVPSDVQPRSCPTRWRRLCGGALYAADAADPAWRIRGPQRKSTPRIDRARVCAVVFRRRPVAERDHPHFRLRSQCASHRRGRPAARVWGADDLAGTVRMAVDPDQRADPWQFGCQHPIAPRQHRRFRARHHTRSGLDTLRRSGTRFDPHHRRDIQRHRMGEHAAGGLRHRCGDPDAGDCLWRPGRHHPYQKHRAHIAETAAGVRRRRDRVRDRVLFPIRHADRGVADSILPERPGRPVINPRPKETSMTIRSLATSASVIALCLVGAALSGVSGEAARGQTAPFAVAAAQGTAPNFAGISNWFNSAPLNIADLRGKVVLVDFWTYGCVNCVNTLPHVTELYAKYKDRGLVVVGVHTPEFPFERSASNVQAALKRHGITYPVGQDNESQTWNAYRNQYWPAQYIVDQNGKIVFQHDGEGQYEQIDRTIARLLNASS